MQNRKLLKSFAISRFVFSPAQGPVEKAENHVTLVHRLRMPLRYTGKDPAAVLDWCTRARGEDLLVRFDLNDAEHPVEVVARIESAGVKLAKGEKKPPVLLSLVVETEDVTPIATLLAAAVRAARAELAEVDVSLQVIQENLPGLEEEQHAVSADEAEDPTEPGSEDADGDGEPAVTSASPARKARKSRRRPKGSSPAPRT